MLFFFWFSALLTVLQELWIYSIYLTLRISEQILLCNDQQQQNVQKFASHIQFDSEQRQREKNEKKELMWKYSKATEAITIEWEIFSIFYFDCNRNGCFAPVCRFFALRRLSTIHWRAVDKEIQASKRNNKREKKLQLAVMQYLQQLVVYSYRAG